MLALVYAFSFTPFWFRRRSHTRLRVFFRWLRARLRLRLHYGCFYCVFCSYSYLTGLLVTVAFTRHVPVLVCRRCGSAFGLRGSRGLPFCSRFPGYAGYVAYLLRTVYRYRGCSPSRIGYRLRCCRLHCRLRFSVALATTCSVLRSHGSFSVVPRFTPPRTVCSTVHVGCAARLPLPQLCAPRYPGSLDCVPVLRPIPLRSLFPPFTAATVYLVLIGLYFTRWVTPCTFHTTLPALTVVLLPGFYGWLFCTRLRLYIYVCYVIYAFALLHIRYTLFVRLRSCLRVTFWCYVYVLRVTLHTHFVTHVHTRSDFTAFVVPRSRLLLPYYSLV